jgi:integrase
LEKMGISKEESKSRNIVFHNWRHRYASKMADLVDARSLSLATEHKTQSMLEHYADYTNEGHFQAVMGTSEKSFGHAR